MTMLPKLPTTSSLRNRLPGAQTAKTVVAAVVSYVVAAALTRSSSTLIAPLTALLVTQVTVFETLTTSTRRVVAVVSGVLLALSNVPRSAPATPRWRRPQRTMARKALTGVAHAGAARRFRRSERRR